MHVQENFKMKITENPKWHHEKGKKDDIKKEKGKTEGGCMVSKMESIAGERCPCGGLLFRACDCVNEHRITHMVDESESTRGGGKSKRTQKDEDVSLINGFFSRSFHYIIFINPFNLV